LRKRSPAAKEAGSSMARPSRSLRRASLANPLPQ
jgi:hypothetical protein